MLIHAVNLSSVRLRFSASLFSARAICLNFRNWKKAADGGPPWQCPGDKTRNIRERDARRGWWSRRRVMYRTIDHYCWPTTWPNTIKSSFFFSSLFYPVYRASAKDLRANGVENIRRYASGIFVIYRRGWLLWRGHRFKMEVREFRKSERVNEGSRLTWLIHALIGIGLLVLFGKRGEVETLAEVVSV